MRYTVVKSKKIIPIFFATLFGLGIILIALKQGGIFGRSSTDPTSISPSDDSWKNALSIVPQQKNSVQGVSYGLNGDVAKQESGLTTTDAIAQKALIDTLMFQTKQGPGTISDADAELLSKNITSKIKDQNPVKQYSKKDITVVPTSADTFSVYKKALTKALTDFSKNNKVNELLVFAEATDKKDEKILTPLADTVKNYKTLIASLLQIKTPEIMANIHILMIQGYATTLSGVEDMQQVFKDPARGANGINKYHEGTAMITRVNQALTKR